MPTAHKQPRAHGLESIRMKASFARTAADQAVYSAGTLVLQFGVLRSADASGLATFGVAYAGFWIAAGTARAVFGESQLVIRARHRSGEGAGPRARHVLTYCLVTLVVGLVAAAFVGVDDRPQAVAMALSIPAVIVADVVRYSLFAIDRPGKALVLDTVWLALQIAITACVVVSDREAPFWIVVAWGGGAAVAVLVCAPRLALSSGGARSAERARIGKGMGAEFMLASGILQLLPFVLYAGGATIPLAALRAAQTIVAPTNLVFTVGTMMSYSYIAGPANPRAHRVGLALASAVVFTTVGLWAALYLAPPELRDALIGPNWQVAQLILIPVLAQVGLNGVVSGGIVASRVLRTPRANLLRGALTVPGLFIAPLVGASLAGSTGLGLGLAAGTAIAVMVWWVGLPRGPRADGLSHV